MFTYLEHCCRNYCYPAVSGTIIKNACAKYEYLIKMNNFFHAHCRITLTLIVEILRKQEKSFKVEVKGVVSMIRGETVTELQ